MTGQQLVALWAERDERYRTRKVGSKLTKQEETYVREFRSKELSRAGGPGLVGARLYLLDWPTDLSGTVDATT